MTALSLEENESSADESSAQTSKVCKAPGFPRAAAAVWVFTLASHNRDRLWVSVFSGLKENRPASYFARHAY